VAAPRFTGGTGHGSGAWRPRYLVPGGLAAASAGVANPSQCVARRRSRDRGPTGPGHHATAAARHTTWRSV